MTSRQAVYAPSALGTTKRMGYYAVAKSNLVIVESPAKARPSENIWARAMR